MSPEDSTPAQRAPSAAVSKNVTLSPWVNEQFPAWERLLSAHDVARLTRRPRWWLLSMAVIGQFPRKQRFHGRGIGWLRCDVLHWLAKERSGRCRPHGDLSLSDNLCQSDRNRRLRMGQS
jgi:predicted DNA-binding transcriptional regulator AlpA